MSAEAALVHTFPVGRRTVTLSMPAPKRGADLHASVEWDPDFPGLERLSAAERRQYDTGMAHVMQLALERLHKGR